MSRAAVLLAVLTALACGSSSNLADAPNGTIVSPAADVTIGAGQSVTFKGSCTPIAGHPVAHHWTFSGAAPDAQVQNPGAVTFAAAGTYSVSYVCSDTENGLSDPSPDTRTVTVLQDVPQQLSGTVTFDKVPSTDQGLDFASTTQEPVRGAKVAVVDAATHQTVLATTTTGEDGSYALSWTTNVGQVQVVVYASTVSPPIIVQDNTSSGAPWGMASAAIDPLTTTTLNLNAASGWDGTSYGTRSAAPFAVLDAAYQAAASFLAVRPDASFPELRVNWSPNNAPTGPQGNETQEQAYAAGHIGTSHWNGSQLYILGLEDVDTDEFDDHVIVHEWGHYFESTLGRSDNPGGSHSAGQIKDPRLSFGEGWGNALSAMVWAPRTEYTDSSGSKEASGFGFDLEDNVFYDPSPGWYSESSVQSVLFDLFDDSGAFESFDSVALGLGPIYDVMTGAQKNTPALTTLFSFIAALEQLDPTDAPAIDTLSQYRGVFGAPVADAYGTGETNSGGNSDNLPLYHSLTVGGPVETVVFAPDDFNALSENRYLRFTGDGATHAVSFSTTGDINVGIYANGALLDGGGLAEASSGSLSVPTANGQEYIIVVTCYSTTSAQTDVSVQ